MTQPKPGRGIVCWFFVHWCFRFQHQPAALGTHHWPDSRHQKDHGATGRRAVLWLFHRHAVLVSPICLSLCACLPTCLPVSLPLWPLLLSLDAHHHVDNDRNSGSVVLLFSFLLSYAGWWSVYLSSCQELFCDAFCKKKNHYNKLCHYYYVSMFFVLNYCTQKKGGGGCLCTLCSNHFSLFLYFALSLFCRLVYFFHVLQCCLTMISVTV